MENINHEAQIKALKALIDTSVKIVAFTGAGISTDSGIPDYRSQGGIWEQYQPVYFDEFVRDPSARRLYWQRKWELWPALAAARPGPGHRYVAGLHETGKLTGVVTQNIDGLHERSGVPREDIVNLHGTALWTRCLDCDYEIPSHDLYESHDLESGVPLCPECGGLLKPATISFGQNLEKETITRAEKMALECDLLLVFGSTLIVYPAANIPTLAKRAGAKVAIVTLSETPFDYEADLVINEPIAKVVGGL